MKRGMYAAALLLILGGTATRLVNRWREERADHRLTLLVDWSEVREAALRQSLSDQDLLERLKGAGATALLVGASTVQDYLWQGMSFESRALAETVRHQLEDRGVTGVTLQKSPSRKFKLICPAKDWDPLKDVELGFNPEFLGLARQAGFHLVLRVNHDPWLTQDKLFASLAEIASAHVELGFLLNTDEVPGGADALRPWISFLESQNFIQLLFEFHPSKSALRVAYLSPRSTYRSHTIPPSELKDLKTSEERSRWFRAVQERSCRFLLVHIAPTDSLVRYFETLYALREDFTHQGWEIAWPKPRMEWSFPSFIERQGNPVLALLLAIVLPIAALRAGFGGPPWKSYVTIFVLTLAGACVVSALSDNPLSRIEVVPFRGVKLAFALAWIGCFASLYSREEIKNQLFQNVRRVDVLLALALVSIAGYFILRTGNAGAGWKVSWEQGVRDRLEYLLVARPRFKEFAIGYPLLLLGLHMEKLRGRFLVGVGMIGPISMVNTFCHLHSPLYLAFWRSTNGFLLGTLVGIGFLVVRKCRS